VSHFNYFLPQNASQGSPYEDEGVFDDCQECGAAVTDGECEGCQEDCA
jgi:hypothetical protein